ncbi:MAG: hypothetical protein ACAH35_04525 [Candidatus Paceibacterota bacterium]
MVWEPLWCPDNYDEMNLRLVQVWGKSISNDPRVFSISNWSGGSGEGLLVSCGAVGPTDRHPIRGIRLPKSKSQVPEGHYYVALELVAQSFGKDKRLSGTNRDENGAVTGSWASNIRQVSSEVVVWSSDNLPLRKCPEGVNRTPVQYHEYLPVREITHRWLTLTDSGC